jgi:LmbE family N-acetylglucosaminyl deacetylase
MRVLAVGAHPDDLEILCGGTLARFVAEGHHVVMAHACWGDKGHGEIPHNQVAQVRDREAKAAAKVMGADSMVLGFPKERGNHAI